ncbi:MAG: hypothetical protein KAG56_11495 [Sulfurovaceae bacterium]|nr:hypothetical protein [Sulfurovaceae bacterium]
MSKELASQRFWEFYLVRYLSGTIFAVIIIFYLAVNYENPINTAFTHNDKTSFPVVEKVRTTIFNSTEIIEAKEKALIDKQVIKDNSSNNIYHVTHEDLTFEGMIFLFAIGSLYMYISSIPIYFLHIFRGLAYFIFPKSRKSAGLYKFYNASNNSRKELENDYVNSYKHMREHGNAFGIMIMEIFFACYLIIFSFSIISLVIWLSFGFLGWFLGQYLEYQMVVNHKSN